MIANFDDRRFQILSRLEWSRDMKLGIGTHISTPFPMRPGILTYGSRDMSKTNVVFAVSRGGCRDMGPSLACTTSNYV